MTYRRTPGHAIYPGATESEELIFANALVPLARIPGNIANDLFKKRQMSLMENKFANELEQQDKEEYAAAVALLAG